MMNAGVATNKYDSASYGLPLPLNLIALIIAYVSSSLPFNSIESLTCASSIAPQILPPYAEHVESSTI